MSKLLARRRLLSFYLLFAHRKANGFAHHQEREAVNHTDEFF